MFSLLSLIFGMLLTLAFAPLNWWVLSFVSLVGISWLWLNPKHDAPIRYGFLFGLGNFATGVYWVYISLQSYGGASWFFAILANVLLVIYLALYPMAVGLLLRLLKTRPATLYRALMIALLWMAGEWLRSYVLSGFPWLSIGYSQLTSPFHGLAPIAGQFGVGLVVMIFCALIAYALSVRRISPIIVSAFILAGAWATQKLQFSAPIGSPISVALVQGNTPQLSKWDPQEMDKEVGKYITLTSKRHEKVIIWPESAVPFMASSVKQNLLDPLDKLYLEKQQSVVMGILTGDYAKHEYYNSALVLGQGSGLYSKHHLLPFGEYLPLRSVFAFFKDYVDIPMSDFSRGKVVQAPVITSGIPAGVSICFEGAFGRVIRRAMPNAQYLINISDDGWFKKSWAGNQHLQMDQMRALELDRDMARATNTGITAFINAHGRIVSTLPREETGVLSGWIQPRIGETPYAQYGNAIFGFTLLLYAIIMALIFPFRNNHARAISSQPYRT